jgi:hypothetical protein
MLARNAKACYIESTHKLGKIENSILQFYYINFVNTQTRRFFMLKKIIAASAVLAFLSLFACSSDDDKDSGGNGGGNQSSGSTDGNTSSGSTNVNQSSSSLDPLPNAEEVTIAFQTAESMFGTYVYSYTLVNDANEDLTQFWNCSAEEQDDPPASTCANKAAQEAGAVLQNDLTNQYSSLHYIVSRRVAPWYGAELKSYRLQAKSQAALGINVANPDANDYIKNIGEVGPTDIDNAVGFLYRYTGGAHEFRVAINENAFWFVYVPASPPGETATIKIPFGDFMAGTATTEMPLNLSKAAQFMWVVAYSANKPENNTGSLIISYFKALK